MKGSLKDHIAPAIIFILTLFFMMANPFQSASAALSNGVYSVPYTVIKPDDGSASMADGYLVKPATVTVKDGSYTVKLTIKNSSWITEFKPNGANPAIIGTSGDTRTVQFSANITSPVVTKMKVDIDDMNYHHEYTVRLSFNTGSAKLISGGEEKPKEETKQEEKKEETTTAPKAETPVKEKPSESTSSATAKKADNQSSNQQTSSSTAKASTSSESAKTAADSSGKTSVAVAVSSENEQKKAEEKEAEDTNKNEKVTKESSEEKEAEKEEESNKGENAEETEQSIHTDTAVKETASEKINEENGIGLVVWSILAGIVVLIVGLGIYRYKLRK